MNEMTIKPKFKTQHTPRTSPEHCVHCPRAHLTKGATRAHATDALISMLDKKVPGNEEGETKRHQRLDLGERAANSEDGETKQNKTKTKQRNT